MGGGKLGINGFTGNDSREIIRHPNESTAKRPIGNAALELAVGGLIPPAHSLWKLDNRYDALGTTKTRTR
jgi:hypothetical protein